MLSPEADRHLMRTFERFLGSGKLGWYRLSALLVSVVAVAKTGLDILPNWQKFPGVEAHWIAQSLAAGKGYSFPPGCRWLFEFVECNLYLRIDDGVFHLTAWADPVYTFCLAGLIWLFGDYHQLAAAVFNLILLLLVLGLTYRLCERLISAPAGVIAVVVLVLERNIIQDAVVAMTNAMLATTLVVLSALTLVKFLKGPSYHRAGVLGLVLGLTALGCPSAQLFTPVAAAAVAVWGRKNLRPAVSQAILMLVMAAIIVMPWTVRNYMVFEKFVPVRTGFGQIAWVGVVATGGMVAPEKLHTQVIPPLSAGHAREAVRKITPPHDASGKELEALERFQLDYAKEVGGAEYATMNEAQRDSWFLQETKAFLVANPVLSARLSIAKLEQFARVFGPGWKLSCLLAALGGLLAIRKPAVLILALWVGAYIGPFLLAICYYPHYRAPIEPLLVVLAVFAVWQVLGRCSRRVVASCALPERIANPVEESMRNIAVLIPCYNEEKTVAGVVRNFRAQLPDAAIYVYDNNSTDRTAEEAARAGAIVRRETRQGKGNVVQSMFQQIEADIYVMVDGDGTYPADRVHDLIAPVAAGDADMVTGSRLHSLSESSFKNLNLLGNKMFLFLLNSIFKVRLTDLLSGYRAFNRDLVKNLPVLRRGFEIETELTLKAIERNYRIVEIPVNLSTRPEGSESKIHILRDGILILKTIFALLRDYKPLTAFGSLGLFFVVLGFIPGFVVIREFLLTRYISHVPSAILAVGLVVFGTIIAFIGLVLHAISCRFQEVDYQLRGLAGLHGSLSLNKTLPDSRSGNAFSASRLKPSPTNGDDHRAPFLGRRAR